MSGEGYCLKWNDHHSVFFNTAEQLCHGDHLTDVTLSCGEREFSAHKLVLSVCSSYFSQLFAPRPNNGSRRRPADSAAIVYLRDVDARHMELLLNYMYRGEINVEESELIDLLATAKSLQIKGLTEDENQATARTASAATSGPSGSNKRTRKENNGNSGGVKRMKEETLKEEDFSQAVTATTENTEFVDIHDPSNEMLEQPEYDIDEEGESMMYENDPDNPSVLQQTVENVSIGEDVIAQHNIKAEDPLQAPPKEATHVCFACPKAFVHKWMLERHTLTHTGEQPFACSICQRRFSLQSSCLRHVRHVHKDVEGQLSNYIVRVNHVNTPQQSNFVQPKKEPLIQ